MTEQERRRRKCDRRLYMLFGYWEGDNHVEPTIEERERYWKEQRVCTQD